jgi:predicted metal-dependent hydrolase
MRRDPATLFDEGVALFNRGEFFACHEALEEIWTSAQEPERWFLQSLIHFAVGLYHHERRNRPGACRQLRKCLRKIRFYVPEWGGVRTDRVEQDARSCLAIIEGGETIREFPRIEQVAPYEPSPVAAEGGPVGGAS